MFMYYTERLKELRSIHGFTQQDVANKLGLKREQYRRYEVGINEMKATHIIKLCKLFHVSSDYLLGLSDDKNQVN